MGTREGIEITEKGNLVVGKIVMGQDPISLVLVSVGIVHVRRNPVDTQTVHVHGNMQTGIQIPQRSDGPVTPPWML